MSEEHRDADELINRIKGFWDERAEHFSGNIAAATNDPLIKKLELAALERVLDTSVDVLEAGCGNGTNLLSLASRMKGRLYGFDYSEAMIRAAEEAALENGVAENLEFSIGDVRGDLSHLGRFRQIFTDRCLINLPTHELQVEAALNLATRLEEGGHLILIECAQQPLERLNRLRALVDLEPIPEHWHNHYIDEDRFLGEVSSKLELKEVDAFSSLYYVISRVFNAKLTPEGEKPDYMAEINQISCRLPSIGDYGPHKLYLFER